MTDEHVLMKKFQCFDCGHAWQIIFGGGDRGIKQACSRCKSLNVKQVKKIHSCNREDNKAFNGDDGDTMQEKTERKRGQEF